MPLHILGILSIPCEHRMEFLPTPLQQTAQGYLPDFWRTSWPSPETRNLVSFMLTWSPLLSMSSPTHIEIGDTLLLVVRDEHQVISVGAFHGTPVWNSRNSASSTRMNSNGLRIQPWCTTTPMPNSSLCWPLTHTRLQTLEFMPRMTYTDHSSTPRFLQAHHRTFLGNDRWLSLWCTSPAAGERWRWCQWYLYQTQSRTASHRCSPSRGCKSLVPIPAASWLDLWAWDHDNCHGQGLHLCPYRGSEWSSPPSLMGSHHSWKQPLSLVSPAQLFPHQQLSASQHAQLQCQMGQQPCCISFCCVLCGSWSWTHWELGQQLEGPLGAHCLAI